MNDLVIYLASNDPIIRAIGSVGAREIERIIGIGSYVASIENFYSEYTIFDLGKKRSFR